MNTWSGCLSWRIAGATGAIALTALVVIHGLFLPEYAHNETPQPGVLRLFRDSDIGLQWHQDARIEMESARDFPRQLAGRSRMRRNRPVYSVAPLAGDAARTRDDQARLAAWCLIATNLVYLGVAMVLLFDATRRCFGPDAAALAVLLLLSLRFMHRYAAECLTHVYIHLPATVLLWLAVRGAHEGRRDDRRGAAAAFGWGCLFGVFYLVKQNVAVAAALFAVFLLLRNWRSAAAYVAGLPLAYGIWRVLIHWADIPYANIEMQRYGQGSWVLKALASGQVAQLVNMVGVVLRHTPGVMWRHFGLILPLAAAGAWLLWRRDRPFARRAARFGAVLGACTFAQTYAARLHTKRYIWAELCVVLCPLAGLAAAQAGTWVARLLRARRVQPPLAVGQPDATAFSIRLLVAAAIVTLHALIEYNRLMRGGATTAQTLAFGAAAALLTAAYLAVLAQCTAPAGIMVDANRQVSMAIEKHTASVGRRPGVITPEAGTPAKT